MSLVFLVFGQLLVVPILRETHTPDNIINQAITWICTSLCLYIYCITDRWVPGKE